MIKLSKEDKFFTIKKSAIDTEKALKELDKKSKRQKKKRNLSLSRYTRRSI